MKPPGAVMRRAALTIAYMDGPLVSEPCIQSGVIARARARGCRLFAFAGGMLDCPREYEAQRSVIFSLYDQDRFDGLIVSSDYLGHNVGAEKIRAFCRQFLPTPVVNTEYPSEGIPTLVTNFYQGMYDLISHLIEVHQYTRIAFIRGLEQSSTGNDRYQAYRDALRDHAIPFDENLVAPGHFYSPSGSEAVKLFLDQRGLRPGTDLQAIAAVTDYIALDVLAALKEREIQVPQELAVVGFDDNEEAYSAEPPLTSVRMPFVEMGEWEVDTLLAQIRGEVTPGVTSISVSQVVRQSCGCINQASLEAPIGDTEKKTGGTRLRELLIAHQDRIVSEMVEAAGIQDHPAVKEGIEAFFNLFLQEITAEDDQQRQVVFIRSVQAILKNTGLFPRNSRTWNEILSTLRREILARLPDNHTKDRLEGLCHQVRVLITDLVQQSLSQQQRQSKMMNRLLQAANQEMSTALSVGELMDVLANSLPHLGIPGCYLALYVDPAQPAARSRLCLAYDGRGRVDLGLEGMLFPSRQLVPEALLDPGRPQILIIEPIFFRIEQLGFVVFEVGSEYLSSLYEALGEQISITLKRIYLHQIVDRARQAAEEADHLKSRFLSTVSHEIGTPLGMIISLSELLLEEKESGRAGTPLPYQHELEVIHATGQHLERLLRDVLDLGRSQMGQLKLVSEPVDLMEVVREAACVGEELAREKGLRWILAVPPSLPRVWGDRTRLRQILLNLVSNACKFTNRGQVVLEVKNDPSWIYVSVHDTGLGVPPEEQETIFDEFRQSERSAARGYGGMGLGLAITRRLVEMHGGKITVRSSGQEGAGATFTLQLPVLAGQAGAPVQPNEWNQAVIILTHRTEGNSALRQHLEEHGFRVIEQLVRKEGEWLRKVTEAAPGAVILDCEPAAAWGLQLIQALKENPATGDLPVLFACVSMEEDCGGLLEFDYLIKPVGLGSLEQALERWDLKRAPRPGETRHVLVVDDEPAVLDLHARRVREQLPGAIVLEARNGLQALEIMQKVRPDLVLLDLMMPELDGFGVLERIRAMESTRDVPVIVLTAQNLTEEVLERLNRGVASVLAKGIFHKEEILAQVQAALERSKRLGSEAQRIARHAMAYIHAHFSEPITRQEIASAIGVNERYLTRCFHEESGIPPMEYLSRHRVKQAKKLLEEGGKSITEVALETGFSSSAYFSRVFRKETGMTPLEYRYGKQLPS